MNELELKRFRTKYSEDPVTSCWNWKCGFYPTGYGMFFASGRSRRAHRISYEHFVGPLNEMDCCHKCDNPRCVNPEHLFKGTASDNMLDASRKGRHGSTNHRELWRGELNSAAKLTDKQVSEIKARILSGEKQVGIAKEYGVSKAMVSSIKLGKNWTHVKALAEWKKITDSQTTFANAVDKPPSAV